MKSVNSTQLIEKIEETLSNIKSFNGRSPLAESYYAQFLVVFICGIYEEIIESTITEMVYKTNNVEIRNFVEKLMEYSFQNPNLERVKDLIYKFDNQNWINEINLIPEKNRSALNSICENKNALAHGTSTFTLTISDVENYYIDSKMILEKIDDLLL